MNAPPVAANAASLRAAGRHPALPFGITFENGDPVEVTSSLRILPEKRIVGEGRFNGASVLVKLFIAANGERHWQREQHGITALTAAGLPTPEIIASGKLAGGGYALLSRFLNNSTSLDEQWQHETSEEAAVGSIIPALALVGRMHSSGLVHDDLHLGNFLVHNGDLYIIDGDAVRSISAGKPLNPTAACANLAILLAQLPVEYDVHLDRLLDSYHQNTTIRLQPDILRIAVKGAREQRMQDFLSKSLRDCTLFSVRQTLTRFTAMWREHAAELTPLAADPDHAMARGKLLKDGGTATVARIDSETLGALVVKRYNLKNRRHALSRVWRPSRAWHSWREGLRLHFLGIPTPRPLALVEERTGPLRRRAWLFTACCDGPDLLDHLAPSREPPAAEAEAIVKLFTALHRERISHGDLKATNLLWRDGRVWLIDLDAVRQHRTLRAFSRAWRRDRARLLRNWPADSMLYRWFDAVIPSA